MGSIPGSGRCPGRGQGNPLQYSCLENPMDRGAWQATVHRGTGVGHNWSDLAHTHNKGTSCKAIGRMQKSTSHSVVPWGQFQQGAVSIPRLPGVRERTGYWDQRREEVSRTRGGESCVERAPGQNCDPQSKEATNRTGKTDPRLSFLPLRKPVIVLLWP